MGEGDGDVVHPPAEGRVVEVDDGQAPLPDQQVPRMEIGVDHAEDGGIEGQGGQAGVQGVPSGQDQAPVLPRQGRMVPEGAPSRRRTHQAVGVQAAAREAFGWGPGLGLQVGARHQGPQAGEPAGTLGCPRRVPKEIIQHLAFDPPGHPGQPDLARRLDRLGDEGATVPRRQGLGRLQARRAQGTGPDPLGLELGRRIVARPVEAQDPVLAGRPIGQAEGDILGDGDEGQAGLGDGEGQRRFAGGGKEEPLGLSLFHGGRPASRRRPAGRPRRRPG